MSGRGAVRGAALAVVLAGMAASALHLAGRPGRAEAADCEHVAEAAVLERDLAFFEARVARDSFAARDQGELARLYLQRARLSGTPDADLARAEEHARRSLALRTAHNGAALQALASSLMGQHRFAEARDAAERLLAADSTSRPVRALLGEIQLELGDYGAAARTFGMLFTARRELAVAPRYARWEEIRGHPGEARTLLRAALAEASSRHAMPRSQLAWFHWRLSDLALRSGRLDEAEHELQAGLRLVPDDHRLLDGRARVAAARGRWREAIDLGERAIAQVVDPATLGLLSLGYGMLGDRARSAEYDRAMATAVQGRSDAMHRAWSLHLLDRGREVPAVLAAAREEIRARRDVYAWDLLAWALYRSGAVREALEASANALAMGTRDASLYFHAGRIAAAAGRGDLARIRLERALAINPRWHPTQPREARALLERLR